MNTDSFFYPFDPTGKATTNLVSGERQVVNSTGIMDFFYIVPKAGPYFRNSLKVKLYPSGAELIEGVDYNPTHLFSAASHATGFSIFGSITFYDHTLTGTVSLEYQTLGGDWVIDEAKITTVLANVLVDPRITTWDEVVDLPYQFPVIDHEFNIDDFVGAEDIVASLTAIRESINAAAAGTSASHLLDYQNPHRTTAAQVGLGLVDNFATASQVQATTGTNTSTFMTPLRTFQAIQALAWNRIDTHVQRTDNPHDTTKAHVGLGNVENYIIASTLEAEAGSSSVRYMTPLRTKEAITKFAVGPLNTYIARRDNPNDVTAAQVGLGNVSNFATGTSTDATEGTAADKFLAVREIVIAIKHFAKDHLDLHVANMVNPHGVTKDQVGLGLVQNYPVASTTDAADGTSDTVYTTPKSVRQMIAAFAPSGGGGGGTSDHETLTNNPHSVTATQVGLGSVQNYATATQQQAESGTATNLYMTAAGTKQAITFQVGNVLATHVNDNDNPHNTTPAGIGTYDSAYIDNGLSSKLDLGASAANAIKVYGQTKPELLSDIVELTVANSLLLNGKSISEIVTMASTGGNAANSLLLGGKTTEEILLEFIASGRAGANQTKVVGLATTFSPSAPTVPITVSESWTKLGVWVPNPADVFDIGSIAFIIEGGSSGEVPTAPVALASFAIDQSMWNDLGTLEVRGAKLSPMSNVVPGYELFFKYSTEGITDTFVVELWMRNGELRNTLSITELTGRKIRWNTDPVITNSDLTITVSPIPDPSSTNFKSSGTAMYANNLVQAAGIVTNWLNNL